ncbi:non-hydrolyzing UDP-N-acetylglucosamine 2-epimerase [Desulfobulbus alkaliphilus]|uniref:non-hydrolyzing UDP-N-acetylglucosamine 2-epimerase n=1 Tax=Desulfobulbus alkaliphilus TaxID=869814 RepID=UPI0019650FF8|nr:UDP-N-acetylglucosamine 2-epimerase (non-hydrolyzing) [Desulfobulbus alkaliphilus]MBM9538523.1 UDP-N-acetylglucosamine 2-epimerase (non-hydrolyzing) [Desulfobulbus alkaliphilus]
MLKIVLVAGARPNFMKIAPILREMRQHYAKEIHPVLVHTGQHYDENMSGSFFAELGIAQPDYNLEVGSGSHAEQTAAVMVRFEKVCRQEQPDMVLVVGDVNSTIAAGLVAKKMNTCLVHVEAGLRSQDRSMPEEINRLATDAITDIFFTTEKEGTQNLLHEGKEESAVHFVGHVMVDNLFYQLEKLNECDPKDHAMHTLKQRLPDRYACLTLHRPANVDTIEDLQPIVAALQDISKKIPVIFPCHPRTLSKLKAFDLLAGMRDPQGSPDPIPSGIVLMPPLGYNDFLYLWKDAAMVLTDSGGLQEETTALKVPCLTLRTSTERPITLEQGSNILIGRDMGLLKKTVSDLLAGNCKKSSVPALWDGHASRRIVQILTGTNRRRRVP